LLFDETREELPPVALIAQIYRLTSAEARLVQALLAGDSLNEYAGRAGLSRNTIKTQLGALFGKTETRCQSELIRQHAWGARRGVAWNQDRASRDLVAPPKGRSRCAAVRTASSLCRALRTVDAGTPIGG
jgi:DNA-binding CsgD family transcriptional regulator